MWLTGSTNWSLNINQGVLYNMHLPYVLHFLLWTLCAYLVQLEQCYSMKIYEVDMEGKVIGTNVQNICHPSRFVPKNCLTTLLSDNTWVKTHDRFTLDDETYIPCLIAIVISTSAQLPFYNRGNCSVTNVLTYLMDLRQTLLRSLSKANSILTAEYHGSYFDMLIVK